MQRWIAWVLAAMLLAGCATAKPEPSEYNLGPMRVTETPVMAGSGDLPKADEYLDRAKSLVPQVPMARPEPREAAANRVLQRFGWELRPSSGNLLDLYHGDERVLSGVLFLRTPTVNGRGDDFAMGIGDNRDEYYLVTTRGPEPWKAHETFWLPPVYAGNDLVFARPAAGGKGVAIYRGGRIVYTYTGPMPGNQYPIKQLSAMGNEWVADFGTDVVIEGKSLKEQSGYSEVFGWRLVGGQPFYFVKQGDRYGLSYAGVTLPTRFEALPHDLCCEAVKLNPWLTDRTVLFHARKGGHWYVVTGVVD